MVVMMMFMYRKSLCNLSICRHKRTDAKTRLLDFWPAWIFWSSNFIIIILASNNDVYVKYFVTTKSAHALQNKGIWGKGIQVSQHLPTEYKVFIDEIVNLSALVFYNSIWTWVFQFIFVVVEIFTSHYHLHFTPSLCFKT